MQDIFDFDTEQTNESEDLVVNNKQAGTPVNVNANSDQFEHTEQFARTEQFTRKYRPHKFSDVVGQTEAVSVLRNAVANHNLLNFVLLKGTRGSGKCFYEGEFILTPNGYVRAKNLKPTKDLGETPYVHEFVNLEGKTELSQYYYSNGKKPCLVVTTSHGFQLTITPNHPLLVYDVKSKTISYVKAEQIAEDKDNYKLLMHLNTSRFGSSPFTDSVIAAQNYIQLGLFTAAAIRHIKDPLAWTAAFLEVSEAQVRTSLDIVEILSPNSILEAMLTKAESDQLFFLIGLFRGIGGIAIIPDHDSLNHATTLSIVSSMEFSRMLQLMLLNLGVISSRISANDTGMHIHTAIMNHSLFILAHKFMRYYDSIRFTRIKDFISLLVNISFQSADSTLPTVNDLDVLHSDVNLDSLFSETFVENIHSINEADSLPTMDFCMPQSHSFILNGVVNHNTTLARIYAAAVNCEHPVDGNPCGVCDHCKDVFSGNSQDIIEIDAASKRTIDDMRALAKQLDYATFSLPYRVVILDEVHSLTPEAWQSLLKTLEEPRQNCIIEMATTNPEKIPDTILSRAVALTVRRIRSTDIATNLKHICEQENVKYEDTALSIIARKSQGIMRDAVKDLDTVQSVFNGEVTTHEVEDIFSVLDISEITSFIDTLYKEDIQVVLNATREIENFFPDAQKFLEKLYSTVLDCVELKLGVDLTQEYSADDIHELTKTISSIPTKFLWSLLRQIKEQLDNYSSEIPVLDYLAVAMKQPDVEKSLGVEEKPEEPAKPSFDLNAALDAL